MGRKKIYNAITKTVSLPLSYLIEIDRLVAKGKYDGLSHFVREAVADRLEWDLGPEADVHRVVEITELELEENDFER